MEKTIFKKQTHQNNRIVTTTTKLKSKGLHDFTTFLEKHTINISKDQALNTFLEKREIPDDDDEEGWKKRWEESLYSPAQILPTVNFEDACCVAVYKAKKGKLKL